MKTTGGDDLDVDALASKYADAGKITAAQAMSICGPRPKEEG